MKRVLGLGVTAITVGAAFLLSGLIKLAVRGTTDPDIVVGAVFLVLGIVLAVTKRGASE